jgi:L-ascorbate metabolism protein UlaG (beta-lactamase superfamily)
MFAMELFLKQQKYMKRIFAGKHPGSITSVSSAALFFLLLAMPINNGCKPIRSLGRNPSGEKLAQIEQLPNYKNGQFQNLEPTVASPASSTRKKMRWTGFLKYFLKRPDGVVPSHTVPIVRTDLKQTIFEKPTVIWFGHSSFILKTKTANILFDPVFNHYAGPFPGMVKAYAGTNYYQTGDLPPIDAIVISHDHYDHLDYTTVRQLRKSVKKVIVPVGVGSHFIKWKFNPRKITELNWNESVRINENVRIIATPAHHRSNRTFEQRKTLWASYVIEADGYKIYFSGDTGYSSHFSLIGRQYGPFDLAMLECGQYNTRWSQNHMFPWQTAKAAKDLRAAVVVPIHWGRFAESTHHWNEPVKLLLKSADSLRIPVTIPYIGQPVSVGEPAFQETWWLADELPALSRQ